MATPAVSIEKTPTAPVVDAKVNEKKQAEDDSPCERGSYRPRKGEACISLVCVCVCVCVLVRVYVREKAAERRGKACTS